jgi:4-hydroxybenzoyl-CoA reductase subunit alpha
VFCGSTDIGQGSDSVLSWIVGEVLGVDPLGIRVVTSDTDLTPVDLGSYSSRVTVMTGNAAMQAAERARDYVARGAAEHLGVPANRLVFADARVFDSENPDKGISFQEAVIAAEARFGTIGTVGSYTPPKSPAKFRGGGVGPSPSYSYSACVVEVEVDPLTGIYRVPKVWMAHDIGRALNAAVAMGQIEGSVYMGLGEAMMEEMAYRDRSHKGHRVFVHKIPSLLEYKSPSTMEMPEVVTYVVEDPDKNGPFGAKEVGQGPLLPIMPAVANAVFDAVSVRVDENPITFEKVFAAMQAKKEGKDARFGPSQGPDGVPQMDFGDSLKIKTPWQGGDGTAWNEPKRDKKAAK